MKRNFPSVCLSCYFPENNCKCREPQASWAQVTTKKKIKSINDFQTNIQQLQPNNSDCLRCNLPTYFCKCESIPKNLNSVNDAQANIEQSQFNNLYAF